MLCMLSYMTTYRDRTRKPTPSKRGKPHSGIKANPLSRWAEDPYLQRVKQLTKEELSLMGNMILSTDIDTLKYWIKKENCNTLRYMLAQVVIKVCNTGCMDTLDKLLNRLIGKVKDEIDHTANLNFPQVVVTLPSNGKEAPPEDIGDLL